MNEEGRGGEWRVGEYEDDQDIEESYPEVGGFEEWVPYWTSRVRMWINEWQEKGSLLICKVTWTCVAMLALPRHGPPSLRPLPCAPPLHSIKLWWTGPSMHIGAPRVD